MPKARHRKNHKKKVQNFKNTQKNDRNSEMKRYYDQILDMQEKAKVNENSGEVPLDSIAI